MSAHARAHWHHVPTPQVFNVYASKLEKELGVKPKFLVQVRSLAARDAGCA